MKTDWIHYFGYGSLVNRQTRPAHERAHSARLNGWQRVWDHRVTDPHRGKKCTSLSIEPVVSLVNATVSEPVSVGIAGVVVRLPLSELPVLDAREAGYERLSLPVGDFALSPELEQQMAEEGVDHIMVYRSRAPNRVLADSEHPVLLSYVDCVMAGYLERFGAEGVQAMVSSTRGWEQSVFDDRVDPFYPRWVTVSPDKQQLFDGCIGEHRDQRRENRAS